MSGEVPGSLGPLASLDAFRTLIRTEGARLYRDLPWRRTRDPYIVWLSEVMLQQTQVPRVETRMPAWLDRFPSVQALAEAPSSEVLAAWQGMGYNRRALALHRAAQTVVADYDGVFPRETKQLVALPGIGPATAQGIRSFAFDLPGVYLETNVRTVFLHHLFPDVPAVPDRELVPLIHAACPDAPSSTQGDRSQAAAGQACSAQADQGVESGFAIPQDAEDTPRAWYYALLDYGAYLKKTVPNPSRRSAGYTRQSRFEGSRRQKRAHIVRMLLDARTESPQGLDLESIARGVDALERAAGREPVDRALVASILSDLAREGFCVEQSGAWLIKES
ncbi:adenine glycosylase [Collinsella sp. An2]|uniref:adenine glycosylase n=1 Tax=Collinsella sp. An2 TaxID=1965585 RepID=UPI001EF6B365|nr:adenine glycosylase [Collinsella sp. An2]